MKWLTNLKIDLQRWRFRRKLQHNANRDLAAMAKVILRADKLSKRIKKRLFVLRVDKNDYRIYTKSQIKKWKSAAKHLMNIDINFYQTNEYIVHITKKGNESN